MIGVVGTAILLPVAVVGLALGLVRFCVRAVGALLELAFSSARKRLAFHS